jgi:hypothetical protein
MHSAADIYMRQLPCHPAGVRPPFEALISLVQHLPRVGLQLDHRQLGNACQRRDKHREHHRLERNHSYLFQFMPWHGELGRKHDANAYCLHRLHILSLVCLWLKRPADKDSGRQYPIWVHRNPDGFAGADTVMYACVCGLHFLYL